MSAPTALGRVWLERRGGPADGETTDGAARYLGWDAAMQLHVWSVAFPAELLQLVPTGGVVARVDVLPARTSVTIEAAAAQDGGPA